MQEILNIFQSHPYIYGYLTAINLATLIVYGSDKISAQSHAWRTRERTLLLLALIGGSPGALLGMKLFRHKTRKNSFGIWIALILLAQGIAILYLIKNNPQL